MEQTIGEFYSAGKRNLLAFDRADADPWQRHGVKRVPLRRIMQEYIRRLVDEHAEGNKTGFAERVGIKPPEVINAYNAAMGRPMKPGKGNVSVEMLQRIADAKKWPMSRVLHDLEGIARDLQEQDGDGAPAPASTSGGSGSGRGGGSPLGNSSATQ